MVGIHIQRGANLELSRQFRAGRKKATRDEASGRHLRGSASGARTQIPQALEVRVEEDPVDTAVRDGEQQRRERVVLVVEDERRLAVELVYFGLEIDAARCRSDERGDPRGARERCRQVTNARRLAGLRGRRRSPSPRPRASIATSAVDVPVRCGLAERVEQPPVIFR